MMAVGVLLAPAAGAETVDPPPGAPGVTLRLVKANGISMRIAEQGEGPLVVLLHGFPESWFNPETGRWDNR